MFKPKKVPEELFSKYIPCFKGKEKVIYDSESITYLALKKILTDDYHIFPQCNFANFIKKDGYIPNALYSRYLCERVDFLICKISEWKSFAQMDIQQSIFGFSCAPVLVVELDGKSHDPDDENPGQFISDADRDSLLDNCQIQYVRIPQDYDVFTSFKNRHPEYPHVLHLAKVTDYIKKVLTEKLPKNFIDVYKLFK